MWIDEHPYVVLYLVGCVLAVVLMLVKLVVCGLVNWMTKTYTLSKNLKKILPPEELNFAQRAAVLLGGLLLAVALSWINVLVLLWQIVAAVLQPLRQLLSSTPEAVKALRFPLLNNPGMSRESVWAYTEALKIKLGERQPSATGLRSELDELWGYYPSFDRAVALKELNALNVMNPEVVAAAVAGLSTSADEEIEDLD